MKRIISICIVALVIAIAIPITLSNNKAYGAGLTCVWVGAADGTMSTDANWTDCNGSVPGDDDSVRFVDNTTGNITNDLTSGTVLDNLYIGASFNFSGDPFVLSGNIIVEDNTNSVFDNAIEFNSATDAGIQFQNEANEFLTFNDNITLSLGANNFFIQGEQDESNFVAINADISGTIGDWTIDNMMGVEMYTTSSNSITSPSSMIINNAALSCYVDDCAGSTGGTLELGELGYLGLHNNVNIEANIIVDTGDEATATIGSQEGTNTIPGTLNLEQSGLLLTVADGANSLEVSGATTSDESDITVQGSDADSRDASDGVSITGDVSGELDLGIHQTRFSAEGTWTSSGTVLVNNTAVMTVNDINAFSPDTSYEVSEGGSLAVNDSGIIESDFALEGIGADTEGFDAALVARSIGGDITIEGDIALTGDALIHNLGEDAGQLLIINGVISGDASLELWGPTNSSGQGSIDLMGTDPNIFTGDLTVSGGTARFYKEDAVPNDLYVEVLTPAEFTHAAIGSNNALGGNINVDGPDAFALIQAEETVESISGDGIIGIGDDGVLTIVNDEDIEFDGVILDDVYGLDGDRQIIKSGTGELKLNSAPDGVFSYRIDFEIQDGSVVFTDEISAYGYQFIVNVSGGTIKGNGAIGWIEAEEGNISPGESPGCLTSTGNIELTADVSVDVEIAGTTPCTQYDQLIGEQEVILNGATLTLGLLNSFVPTEGNVFTIVSADILTGTFQGIVDGNVYSNSGVNYRVNYNIDPAGEDTITLTVVAPTVDAVGEIPIIGTLPTTGTGISQLLIWSIGLGLLGLGVVLFTKRKRDLIRSAS